MIAAAWTFLGFFFASQHHAIAIARGEPEEIYELRIETTVAMIVWALLTPLVIVIAERLPRAAPRDCRQPRRLGNRVGLRLTSGAAGSVEVRCTRDEGDAVIEVCSTDHNFEAHARTAAALFSIIIAATP